MRLSVTMFAVLILAAGLASVFAQSGPDTVSIYDLQYVEDPESNDQSSFFGDTVVVKGLVMNGPRDLWVGARWAVYIVDPDSFPNPWSGFFIIQHDTTQINTLFKFVEPGMICYFTGVVDEFDDFSQINLYGQGYVPDPVIQVDIVSTGNPFPDPVILTTADLANRTVGEQWESMWVKVENATMVNNSISGNWASFNDAAGETSYIAEYFNWFRDRLGDGTYSWPSANTQFTIQGFTRDENGSPGQVFNINPRDTFDIEILTNPPVISDVERDIGAPTSADAVEVSATIVDNIEVVSANIHYSVNWGEFQTVDMTADNDTFSGTIPAQADGDFVRYFVGAEDNDAESSILPGDTSLATGGIYFYVVRDQGLTIEDVQYTWGYALDRSGFVGHEVTLQGVVMTDSTDFAGDVYIQDAADQWSGIWVNNVPSGQVKGDLIEVTGMIEENFNVTRMDDVAAVSVVTPGVGVYDPVDVSTGDVNSDGDLAEAYESVLLRFTDLTVVNPFADDPSNFGEFEVDDGSGALRVDDLASNFRGNLDSVFALNDPIEEMIAFGYYSFGDYKVLPRSWDDIIGHPADIAALSQALPNSFELEQNYPNPFNPVTTIRYNVPAAGPVSITVYNALGQKIITLVDHDHAPGAFNIDWQGVDQRGNQVGSGLYFYVLEGKDVRLAKKMLLIK